MEKEKIKKIGGVTKKEKTHIKGIKVVTKQQKKGHTSHK